MRVSTVILCLAPATVFCDTRNWNPTGQGCVDPKGFLSCYETQGNNAASCVAICDSQNVKGTGAYQDCIMGCNGAWLASNVGCWIQGCWNQVFSCEYQLTALSYFSGTDLVQNANIPFYPPPDDASGGACSCNLGYVYGNQTYTNFNNACINVAGSGDPDATNECGCCEFSFPVSNILNVCPKSDLSILGFQQELESAQSLISKSADNCAILDNNSDQCVTQFGYPFYGNVSNPLNLPKDVGTEPLSNLPGNAFTDFGAPAYTLKLFPGYLSTITPAAFNADAGVATGSIDATSAVVTATPISSGQGASVTGTGTGKKTGASVAATATGKTSGTGTGTGTGTGAAASSSSTSKSGGARLENIGSVFMSGLVLGIMLFIS